jgi:hypothetical protein
MSGLHLIARVIASPLLPADARGAHPRPVADPRLVLQRDDISRPAHGQYCNLTRATISA